MADWTVTPVTDEDPDAARVRREQTAMFNFWTYYAMACLVVLAVLIWYLKDVFLD